MKQLLLFIVLVIACVASATQKSYQGYKVLSVAPQTDEQAELLLQWQHREGVDFWDGFHRNGALRIMVSPAQQELLEDFLSQAKIPSVELIKNVEQNLARERAYNFMKRQVVDKTSDFNRFWTLEEIYEYMENLSEKFANVQTLDLAKTSEGRQLKGVKIAGNGTSSKNVILIDAGIHAREWAAVMSAVYLIRELTENASKNKDLLAVDWVIIPVANPDGYVYSHTTDRMWRKNRSPQARNCLGVDLNRNFGLEWYSATGSECQLTFPGTHAFSEPESKAIRDLVEKHSQRLHTYLAIHTYGNYVLYPYGYKFDVLIENWKEHHALGEEFAKAVKAYSGRKYQVGNSAGLLYPAYGASDDYVASRGAKISFTLELTGGGSTGFDLPASKMEEVAKETFEGFKVVAKNAAKSNL